MSVDLLEGMPDGAYIGQFGQVLDASGKQLNERGETAAEAALRRSRERVDAMNAFEEQTGMTQAQFQKANREAKPSISEFREATGLGFADASNLLSAATFNQRDPRDWNAIMASDDPALAARLATRQAINAGAYDRNAPPFVQPGFDSSNYRDVQMPAEGIMGLASAVRPTRSNPNYTQYFPVTPGGRRLTQFTGYDPNLAYEDQLESVQAQMQRFGLDPVTDAAYEDSMSYLVEGMDPSIYYGIDFDPTYDPDPRNQAQASAAPVVAEEAASTQAPSFSYAVGETVPDYQVTALPSSMTSVRSSGVRPVIASRPSVRREGIMSALLRGMV